MLLLLTTLAKMLPTSWTDKISGTLNAVGKGMNDAHDSMLTDTAKQVLKKIGTPSVGGKSSGLYRQIEDPYMPQFLKSWAVSAYASCWAGVQDELLDDVLRTHGWTDVYWASRKSRLEHWPEKPSLCKCCRPDYTFCGAIVGFAFVRCCLPCSL